MTKIFKQLARHWAVCLVVFALLFCLILHRIFARWEQSAS